MLNLSHCCWQCSIKALLNLISRHSYRLLQHCHSVWIYWSPTEQALHQRTEMSMNNKSMLSCSSPIPTCFSCLDMASYHQSIYDPVCAKGHSKRLSSLIFIYHFGFFLFECTHALPPAHHSTLCLHQVATNVMEALLLLGGPEQRLKMKLLLSISFVWHWDTCVFLWTAENFSEAK